ncbi:MAG: hypothetical protein WBB65_10035 [Anaerolineales bacterium]
MPTGYCPECDADVKFKNTPKIGAETNCPGCGAYLKVIADAPIELDWADEDWDDVDDSDEGDDNY